MHPLKEYLKDIDEPIQDFACRVGVSRQTLYRIISRSQAPKPALARRIVEATGGAVAFESLYQLGRRKSDMIATRFGANVPPLDSARLKVVLAVVVDHLLPQSRKRPSEEAINIGANAVINTYIALSAITSRKGSDRLRQALRPVLEEIMFEEPDRQPMSSLDQGAIMAANLYYQAL